MNGRGRGAGGAACAAMVLSCAAGALGQQEHVAEMSLQVNAWRFKPLYHEVTGGVRVDGFLALALGGSTTGNNLVAVWYQRGEGTPAEWSAQSWITTDPAEAVKSVKSALGIPSSEDAAWGVDASLAVVEGDPVAQPVGYGVGLLVQDQYYGIVASLPDPAPVVQMLTEAGYTAADIAVDTSVNCVTNDQLETLAAGFEWGIVQPVTTDDEAAAQTVGTSQMIASAVACWIPPPPCVCSWTPWVTGPVRRGACNMVLTGTTSGPVAGGTLYTCNYEARQYYTCTATCTATWTDCSAHLCTQVNIGYGAAGPIPCGPFFVATGGTFGGCVATSTCPGACSATTAPTAPITWGGWGPDCPCN